MPARRVAAARRSGLAAGLAGLVALCALGASAPPPASDILWRIVSECLDPTVADYCSYCGWPIEGECRGATTCEATTLVWAESPEHVAIRDIKMCGCPASFVHGLALPRARVTGVEDPRRPETIWPFAWAAARARIADEREIGLAVNPSDARTQHHLHVHLVRLTAGARERLATAATARVDALERVWEVAARRAASAGLGRYGVLVVREESGPGYLVAVGPQGPEGLFTVSSCR